MSILDSDVSSTSQVTSDHFTKIVYLRFIHICRLFTKPHDLVTILVFVSKSRGEEYVERNKYLILNSS